MSQDMFGSRGRGRGSGGRGRGGDRGGGFRGGSGGRGFSRGMRGGFRGGDRDRGGRGGRGNWGGPSGSGSPSRGGSFQSRGSPYASARGRGGPPGNRGRGGPVPSRGRGGPAKPRAPRGEREFQRFEIKAGLQLYVIFKNEPVVAELEKLPGFHSLNTPHTEKEIVRTILFKDIESLEAARATLDAHENVQSTDHMGLRSSKKQRDAIENRQLYLRFEGTYEEDAVKELDNKIEEVVPLKENSCKVQFSTPEEAESAVSRLKGQIGVKGLKQVDVPYVVQNAKIALASVQKEKIVLRDVPKTVTIKDIAVQFSDAVSFTLFDKTFPASNFCHAVLRFNNTDRVNEILKLKNLKIAGKKVYVFPGYMEFMHEYPNLGEAVVEEPKTATKAKEEEPPNKKRKTEKVNIKKEVDNEEEQNGEDQDEEDDSEEENGEEGEEEDDDDEEEDEDEGEEEDDDDDESDESD